ncbi:HEAT repeat domain-containing protein [Synechococcus sp. CCY9202]|uniref:HEAT repeat domain-containing protein n=1 Tax=Synechococcus sp. CCY9202 TaxID=174698 RepID=UPI002B1F2B9B|nr:HEAT repeat domain-containing protein [Synechococcus sp. CCY9202]MEA5422420.1 HEAT repeat domain-containing protein [Synechococcus sp. CCY9202]
MTISPSTTGETTDLQLTQELIERVQQASTALELLQATQSLAAATHPAAAACLVDVLGFNNPGAAVAAVDGLIALGPQAVEPILDNLDGYNYGARAWAVRALAGIGDVRGLEVLEDALAQDIGPSVRRAAARGLGQLQMQELAEAPRAALIERCLRALEASCGDGEWVVRYAVVVGLESLAAQLSPASEFRQRLHQALEGLWQSPPEATPVVRLRAEQALQRLEGQHG